MRTRPETAAAGNYHSCPGGRHWGPRGAAGILPFAVARDGRVWVLLSHRSRWVQAGDTWSADRTGSADYRRSLVCVTTRRALERALARAWSA